MRAVPGCSREFFIIELNQTHTYIKKLLTLLIIKNILAAACILLLYGCDKSEREMQDAEYADEIELYKKRLETGPYVHARKSLSDHEEFIVINIPLEDMDGDPVFDEKCFVFKDNTNKTSSMTCPGMMQVDISDFEDIYAPDNYDRDRY